MHPCLIALLISVKSWALFSVNIKSSVANIISYPLITHHTQQERRRRRHRHLSTTTQDRQQHGENRGTGTTTTISHDRMTIRRRMEPQQVTALYQGYGTHYVDLWCGTPPQRQTVVVDTGSSVTAFPCSTCHDCGSPAYHIDPLFDETKSPTFRRNSCSSTIGGCVGYGSRCSNHQDSRRNRNDECILSRTYAEGSRWEAIESIDSCYIGGLHDRPTKAMSVTDTLDPRHVLAFDLVFGCQTVVSGEFKTQMADGIIGMNTLKGSFWDQMFKAGKMGKEKKFSLCFSMAPIAERHGTVAGALTLGGVDERFHTSPMVYSSGSNKGREGRFSVQIRKIYLRRGDSTTDSVHHHTIKALDVNEDTINKGGIIVDSGTTDTFWNNGIAAAFYQGFEEITGGYRHNNEEVSLTPDELMALPTILFQLVSNDEVNIGMDPNTTIGLVGSLDPIHTHDVLLVFPPSHYMEYDIETDMYTSRFYPTKTTRGSILGANVIMGHNVLFDSDHHRIGWALSHCDYNKIVSENGFAFGSPSPGNLTNLSPIPVSSESSVESQLEATTEPPMAPPTHQSTTRPLEILNPTTRTTSISLPTESPVDIPTDPPTTTPHVEAMTTQALFTPTKPDTGGISSTPSLPTMPLSSSQIPSPSPPPKTLVGWYPLTTTGITSSATSTTKTTTTAAATTMNDQGMDTVSPGFFLLDCSFLCHSPVVFGIFLNVVLAGYCFRVIRSYCCRSNDHNRKRNESFKLLSNNTKEKNEDPHDFP